MKRRQGPSAGSLDLLLDTICNTFGGVLFLAILFAVLLRNPRAEPTPEEPTQEEYEEASLKMLALENQLQEAQARLETLQRAAETQTDLMQQIATPEGNVAIAHWKATQAQYDALAAVRLKVLARLDARQAALDQSNADNLDLDEQLKHLTEALRMAEIELKKEVEARTQNARLPKQRTSAKMEIATVMRYGRFYIWHKQVGPFGKDLNTDEFVIVADETHQVEVTPKPYAGTPINSSPESREALKKRLSAFRPDRVLIAVVVFDDSFDRFQDLKRVLIEQGFDYRILPKGDEPIYDRGGSGGKVQ